MIILIFATATQDGELWKGQRSRGSKPGQIRRTHARLLPMLHVQVGQITPQGELASDLPGLSPDCEEEQRTSRHFAEIHGRPIEIQEQSPNSGSMRIHQHSSTRIWGNSCRISRSWFQKPEKAFLLLLFWIRWFLSILSLRGGARKLLSISRYSDRYIYICIHI